MTLTIVRPVGSTDLTNDEVQALLSQVAGITLPPGARIEISTETEED